MTLVVQIFLLALQSSASRCNSWNTAAFYFFWGGAGKALAPYKLKHKFHTFFLCRGWRRSRRWAFFMRFVIFLNSIELKSSICVLILLTSISLKYHISLDSPIRLCIMTIKYFIWNHTIKIYTYIPILIIYDLQISIYSTIKYIQKKYISIHPNIKDIWNTNIYLSYYKV